jgi:hypothetical protein
LLFSQLLIQRFFDLLDFVLLNLTKNKSIIFRHNFKYDITS